MTYPQPIPLWRQLQAVARVVADVRQGQSATAALAAVSSALRPGVQALSFEALRRLGSAQALRALLAPRQPPPLLDALLCTALALQCGDPRAYDGFTLVNQAVEAAKRTPGLAPQAAFVNACLRRFLREREALLARLQNEAVARWNHPVWWIRQLQTDWPMHWESLLAAAARHPPMVLRVNARRATAAQYLAKLQAHGLPAFQTGPQSVVLAQACPVQQLPGFEAGEVSVQDHAAQIAAPLLLAGCVRPGAGRVLDACAAPGGKTAHLLEMADLEVTALDVDPLRCERIRQNLQRLNLQAKVLAADAIDVASWWDGERFDAVLLDAPCSASGIVRRHPDIAWLRRETDVRQLAATQSRLLDGLWPVLKPGGRLLYCTCSVFRAEGQTQAAAFLGRNRQAKMLASPGHLGLQASHHNWTGADGDHLNHDGFYYALFEKASA